MAKENQLIKLQLEPLLHNIFMEKVPEKNYEFEEIKCFEMFIDSIGTLRYLCLLCKMNIDLNTNPQIHIQQHFHSNNTCNICSNEYKEFKHFINHVKSHDDRISMNKINRNDQQLQYDCILPETNFICLYCNMEFKNPHSRLKHIIDHLAKPYKCEICEQYFPFENKLAEHIECHRKEHKSSESFSYDNMVPDDNLDLQNDMSYDKNMVSLTKTKSSKQKETRPCKDTQVISWKCDICQVNFENKVDFQCHINNHKNGISFPEAETKNIITPPKKARRKPQCIDDYFICHMCGWRFADKRNLITHYVVHTKEKNHECPICHKKFSVAYTVKEHMRLHTGERPYACKLCNKKYHTSGLLTKHMHSHSNIKPHSCTYCSRPFARLDDLKAHIRIHTGERPYKCDFCNLAFRKTYTLRNHRRLHTGEKPFKCECGKVFAQRAGIHCHIKAYKHTEVIQDNLKIEMV